MNECKPYLKGVEMKKFKETTFVALLVEHLILNTGS